MARIQPHPGAKVYCEDMEEIVNCAHCGKRMMYGDTYTSRTVMTEAGFGYGVCKRCYYKHDFPEKTRGCNGECWACNDMDCPKYDIEWI